MKKTLPNPPYPLAFRAENTTISEACLRVVWKLLGGLLLALVVLFAFFA